jgi:superfamily II DNA or RNA helicase
MWAEDVIGFGCNAIKLSKFSSGNRNQLLSRLQLVLKTSENAKTIVMLSTMQLFTQDHAISEFFETLSPESTQTIFIGDEAHRLGSAGFIKKNPKHFDYIIGLSATPTRAFDEEGSEFLKQYFGEEVYSFSIGDAIQSKCLTPYKYYFHLCRQTEDEYEEFIRIHGQIKKQQAMKFDDDLETQESLKSLLFKRTSLINQTASKVSVLDNFISKTDDIKRALFFASAGATNPKVNPEKIKQLDENNSILNSHSIHYHQLTSEESGSNQAQLIQNKFKNSEYQAITSMRVLDEGVDLPMATTAFLVGSSKSEREWIQRRGRVLRTSPGKEFAIIHDFVTLPFVNQSVDSNWIVDSEIKRLTAFVKDSVNQHIDGEGWDAIEKYRDIHGDS